MRMYDIINDKKEGRALSAEQIRFVVEGYTREEIPDYQVSAWLMAIAFQGMSYDETLELTRAMVASGDTLDLSSIPGRKVDKHSTGGVGDKTSLIAGPLAAACGVPVAKMSGRGLGHTGGTLDKLESIPGMRVDLSEEEFLAQSAAIGLCICGQNKNLTPADKRLYALRDVIAAVDVRPLITSSIMSKKLACGADAILLDVKLGAGAFMRSMEDAVGLAQDMVRLGCDAGRETAAIITPMDAPLGLAIGNSLEVLEAAATLRGQGPRDLTRLCLLLAGEMIRLSLDLDLETALAQARQALNSGAGYAKLREMVQAQGGDWTWLEQPQTAAYAQTVTAETDGWLSRLDALDCGAAAMELGAGRREKGDAIDHQAGIYLQAKPGVLLAPGQPLATLYASDPSLFPEAAARFRQAVTLSPDPPAPTPLLLAKVTKDEVKRFV